MFPSQKSRRYEAVKWVMVFAIGICTGLVRCAPASLWVDVPLSFSFPVYKVWGVMLARCNPVAFDLSDGPLLFQVGLFVDFFVRLFSRLKFHVVQSCILPCFVVQLWGGVC